MPFKSEAQRRYLWANEPEIARDWTDTYGSRIQKNNGGIMSMQGGMKNYLGEQPMVNAPKYWQSAPDHEVTELAYITPRERDVLVDMNMYGTMDGSPNEGPAGIMSLNGWGSTDESQNVSGAAASAAESGRHTADTLAAGMTDKDISDFRSAAINAGAGQTVNAGFFGPKYNQTVQPWEIEAAKTYRNDPANPFAKKAYSNTRGWKSHGFNPLGMMLGFINPALGMAVKGFQGLQNLGTKYGTKMGDWREKFTGYRTQDEWERARQNRINEKRISNILGRKAPITEAMQERLASLGYTGDMPEVGSTGLSRTIADDYSLEDTLRELPITSNRIKEIQNSWDSGIVGTPQGMDLAGARRAMTQPYTVSGPNRDFEIDPYQESFLSPDRNSMFTTNIYESPQGIETLNPSDLPEEFQDMATYASASAPGNNFLYNTGNPYKDNLYNEDGEYDPYSIKEIAT